MIRFNCKRRHKDGTPIVRDLDVIVFAETILADYRPELLEYPGRIDGLHFIEKYLKANLDFQDIFYEEDESPIAGATVFNDEGVRVFDREGQCVKEIAVEADTVIIDNSTLKAGREGFALFTELHEAGHFLMHPEVYKRDPYQLSFFDYGHGFAARSVVMCKRSSMTHQGRLTTQEDFREHQANVFAAALEMPRNAFRKETIRLIKEYDIGRNLNTVMVMPDDFDFDFELGCGDIIRRVSDAFGASRSATEIQMKRLGLLMTEDQYVNRHNILIDRAF
ncbi:ImmA/IrrE family metallo-endopeptidase [Eubacterium sp. AB3007]|uniref:ImmA/IrrE family metallo-endopeptidase n=1 Tax=Eubacterium sp. AB3007 TaxID=1392487 RepID=UPI00048981A7|nr:ImmA/IrrE family metallo-endopeptidase [Eubacterium sp. AB3007]